MKINKGIDVRWVRVTLVRERLQATCGKETTGSPHSQRRIVVHHGRVYLRATTFHEFPQNNNLSLFSD